MNTKETLIFTYAHLPEKIMFLSNPPEDITNDKYNDLKYLNRCMEMVKELKELDFETRSDGVLPYEKNIIVNHIFNRIMYIVEKVTLDAIDKYNALNAKDGMENKK